MKLVRAMGYVAVLVLAGAAARDAAAQSTLTISDASANEPGADTSPLRFEVTLSPPSASTVTVNWATADGTATAPDDYVAGSGVLTYAPGVLAQTITVLVDADALTETPETIQVTLTSPVNATLADGTADGTISDPAVYLVKDFYPGGNHGLNYAGHLTDVAGILFFCASDGTNSGLWTSDGTEAGTAMISGVCAQDNPLDVAGILYFWNAYRRALEERRHCRWNGPGEIHHDRARRRAANFVALGSTLFFTADNRLWKSDGTDAGTVAVGPAFLDIEELIPAGSRLFFFGRDAAAGAELWTSDGTDLGTSMLKDIGPSPTLPTWSP